MTRTTSPQADPGVARAVALGRDHPSAQAVPALLALLAQGQPVPRERIAVAIGRPIGEVDALFAGLPAAQWDDDSRLVGLGLTLVPTPHRFLIDRRTLYTWCASDALIFAVILGRPVRVESTCPATGHEIRLDVEPDRVAAATPDAAVVSADLPGSAAGADIRTSGCVNGRFFASATAAQGWRAEHPDGTVLPVAEEFAVCRQMVVALGWAGGDGAR